jgi:DNA (cytosine-5)-methyltransferase 1
VNAQLPPSFWQFENGAPDDGELIIDSFAGGGGASTGIEMALGRSPDYAINHDPEALALHAANHPNTVHLSKNIYKVDPMDVVGRRKVGLLWASPDCKHFSKAKGGKPVKREIRDLAWTVVLWAERVRPRVIILENVEEFQTWGPLIETEKGIFPCPDRKGETFNEWIGALKKHGYKVEWKELRACDYGAPTTRKRLFLIARCDGKKIVWPEPTHGPGRLPYHTAASHVIDWSIPCPSIFDTSEEIMVKFGVRAIRPLAENTMARIAKGVKRYVLDAVKPFVVTCNHQGDSFRGQDIDVPFHTVTSARDAHGLVMPHITKFQSGAVGSEIDQPLPTITANSFIKRPGGAAPLGIVTPHLMTMRNAGKPHNEVDKPTHTVTAGGAGLSLVAPVLSAAQQGGSNRAADEPVHTITASPKDQNQILAATMVQTGYGEREGQEPRALDVEAPLGTVVAGGAKHAAVTAFLAQHNAGPRPGAPAHDAREPISALTTTGSQQAVVSAGLMNMKGSDMRMTSVEEPNPTVTADGTHQAEVRAFLMKYYGVDQDPRLEGPLSTVTTKDRFGIVTVEGVDYEIVDIGMRMLTPRELFKAQGFPADYEIETGVFDGGERRALTRTAQVRMCGNSVCPPIAAALVRANCADLAVEREEAAA